MDMLFINLEVMKQTGALLLMDSIEKIHRHCKNFDTFKCLLRKHHGLMSRIKLFCELFPIDMVTADDYFEVKEKCDKVCAVCDKFEKKETD